MQVSRPSVVREEQRGNRQLKKTMKLPFTLPRLRPLGSLLQQTGDGGSSSEYDSYDKHRS